VQVGDVQHLHDVGLRRQQRQARGGGVEAADVAHDLGELVAVPREVGDDRLGAAHHRGGTGEQSGVAGLGERGRVPACDGERERAARRDDDRPTPDERGAHAVRRQPDEQHCSEDRDEQAAQSGHLDLPDEVGDRVRLEAAQQVRLGHQGPCLLDVEPVERGAEAERTGVGVELELAERSDLDHRAAAPGRDDPHGRGQRADLVVDGATDGESEPAAEEAEGDDEQKTERRTGPGQGPDQGVRGHTRAN
jgi:hypothetical protein